MPNIIVEYKYARGTAGKRFLCVNPATGAGSMVVEDQASVFATPQIGWEATVKAADALRAKSKNPAKLPSWVRATCGFPVGDGFSPSDPYTLFKFPSKTNGSDIPPP